LGVLLTPLPTEQIVDFIDRVISDAGDGGQAPTSALSVWGLDEAINLSPRHL
jgi:hypothetical protein